MESEILFPERSGGVLNALVVGNDEPTPQCIDHHFLRESTREILPAMQQLGITATVVEE